MNEIIEQVARLIDDTDVSTKLRFYAQAFDELRQACEAKCRGLAFNKPYDAAVAKHIEQAEREAAGEWSP